MFWQRLPCLWPFSVLPVVVQIFSLLALLCQWPAHVSRLSRAPWAPCTPFPYTAFYWIGHYIETGNATHWLVRRWLDPHAFAWGRVYSRMSSNCHLRADILFTGRFCGTCISATRTRPGHLCCRGVQNVSLHGRPPTDFLACCLRRTGVMWLSAIDILSWRATVRRRSNLILGLLVSGNLPGSCGRRRRCRPLWQVRCLRW